MRIWGKEGFMKRSAMFLLTAAMGLSLAACGKAADDKTADDRVA